MIKGILVALWFGAGKPLTWQTCHGLEDGSFYAEIVSVEGTFTIVWEMTPLVIDRISGRSILK